MFCTNCGNLILEGAKFCTNCGAPVVASCGAAPNQDMQPEVPNAVMQEPPATMAPPASTQTEQTEERKTTQTGEFVPGVELGKFKWMSKTIGTYSVASSLGTGTLYIYDNGIKFSSFLGASVGGSGLLGFAASVAVNVAEAYDPNTYPLEQIQELRIGKRQLVFNTLVISMKNGDVWSFTPSAPSSKVPEQILSLLKPYMEN